jgi:hypothetical protein
MEGQPRRLEGSLRLSRAAGRGNVDVIAGTAGRDRGRQAIARQKRGIFGDDKKARADATATMSGLKGPSGLRQIYPHGIRPFHAPTP